MTYFRRTKIAIKMGRSERSKESGEKKDDAAPSVSSDDEDESEDEDEEMDTEGREETPELYRNSSLGMYAGVSFILSVGLQNCLMSYSAGNGGEL